MNAQIRFASETSDAQGRRSKMTNHTPAGWPTLIPRIAVADHEALVSFIRIVFGATGEFHKDRPTELRFGDSMLMVGSTIERESATAFLYVYVQDTDAAYRRALDNDASSLEAPRDMPYGDRRAMIRDRWGNSCQIATHGGAFTP
jgi:PhnB protein